MRILLAVALIGLTACGDPTAPKIPPPDKPLFDVAVSGKWTAPRAGILWTLTFNLTEHRPDSITGTWTGYTQCADYIGGASPNCRLRSGTISSGSRNGDRLTFTMTPTDLPCGYGQLVEVTRNGNTATGTAKDLACGGGFGAVTMPVVLAKE